MGRPNRPSSTKAYVLPIRNVASSDNVVLGLEAESRMLTKRMSMISTHSGDEGTSPPQSYSRSGLPDFSQSVSGPGERRRQQAQYESRLEQARQSPVATRPSAIPRPSLQYSRRETDDQSSPKQPAQRPKRTRTLSTPYVPLHFSLLSHSLFTADCTTCPHRHRLVPIRPWSR